MGTLIDKIRNIDLRSLLHIGSVVENEQYVIGRNIDKLFFDIKKNELTNLSLKSKESGISCEKYCDNEIIVSLSTHGRRFREAYIAIESIMQQSMKPNRIILNLAAEEMSGIPIPRTIQSQMQRGLELNYCEDLLSFKKIIPTLRRFPEAIIITVDDDCIYNYDLIENMFNSYMSDKNAIWANRMHRILFNNDGTMRGYMEWEQRIGNTNESSPELFMTSVGGVLYPPHSLHDDVVRDDIFMNISKYNDDIWCFAMALLNGTVVRKVHTHSPYGEDYLSNDDVQDSGLCQENTKVIDNSCRNDRILKSVIEYYNLSSFFVK